MDTVISYLSTTVWQCDVALIMANILIPSLSKIQTDTTIKSANMIYTELGPEDG